MALTAYLFLVFPCVRTTRERLHGPSFKRLNWEAYYIRAKIGAEIGPSISSFRRPLNACKIFPFLSWKGFELLSLIIATMPVGLFTTWVSIENIKMFLDLKAVEVPFVAQVFQNENWYPIKGDAYNNIYIWIKVTDKEASKRNRNLGSSVPTRCLVT